LWVDRYRFLCLDRTPYPLTRVLSPFQGDTGRDGRLAGRRACAPYGIAMGQ